MVTTRLLFQQILSFVKALWCSQSLTGVEIQQWLKLIKFLLLCAAVNLGVFYVNWTGDQFKIIKVKNAFTLIFLRNRENVEEKCIDTRLFCGSSQCCTLKCKMVTLQFNTPRKAAKITRKNPWGFEMEICCFRRKAEQTQLFRTIFRCPWDRIDFIFFLNSNLHKHYGWKGLSSSACVRLRVIFL